METDNASPSIVASSSLDHRSSQRAETADKSGFHSVSHDSRHPRARFFAKKELVRHRVTSAFLLKRIPDQFSANDGMAD
jgi:hypothetical protein